MSFFRNRTESRNSGRPVREDPRREELVGTLARKMIESYHAGNYVWMWETRADLGCLEPSISTQSSCYWINAMGAMAGLKLGLAKDRRVEEWLIQARNLCDGERGQLESLTRVESLWADAQSAKHQTTSHQAPMTEQQFNEAVFAVNVGDKDSPGIVVNRLMSLYANAPPGQFNMVRITAIDALSKLEYSHSEAEALAPLVHLFRSLRQSAVPEAEDASACYWVMSQVAGETLLQIAKRQRAREVLEEWREPFLSLLRSTPPPFLIPRMQDYLERA